MRYVDVLFPYGIGEEVYNTKTESYVRILTAIVTVVHSITNGSAAVKSGSYEVEEMVTGRKFFCSGADLQQY